MVGLILKRQSLTRSWSNHESWFTSRSTLILHVQKSAKWNMFFFFPNLPYYTTRKIRMYSMLQICFHTPNRVLLSEIQSFLYAFSKNFQYLFRLLRHCFQTYINIQPLEKSKADLKYLFRCIILHLRLRYSSLSLCSHICIM